MTDNALHYHRVSRWLHWGIGMLILVNLALGIFHDAFPQSWMLHHISIGLTVLVLSIFRLLWRITHKVPPLPGNVGRAEAVAARSLHYLFYVFMIVMPLTGWIFTSAGKWPIMWFGLLEVPKWAVTKESPIVATAASVHEVLGFAWVALLVLHVAAAFRHHFILKNEVLTRMWRAAPRP